MQEDGCLNDPATLWALMSETRQALSPRFGVREAAAMTDEIMLRLRGWDRVQTAVRQHDQVSGFTCSEVHKVVARLLDNEPIQYIFGKAHFYGMDFDVDPSTLIPRPETATLVDMIVDRHKASDLKVLDLGTGSGCIAIALARNLPFAQVTATDISAEALDVARRNAERLHTRIRLINSDMLTMSPTDTFDIIVSNPPYIAQTEAADMEANVLLHEPHSALFVPDDDPLRFYNAIARIAGSSLSPGGSLYLEINPRYSNRLAGMIAAKGFTDVEIVKDIEGRDRFITAKR